MMGCIRRKLRTIWFHLRNLIGGYLVRVRGSAAYRIDEPRPCGNRLFRLLVPEVRVILGEIFAHVAHLGADNE